MLTLKVPDGYEIERKVAIQAGINKELLQALHMAWSSGKRLKGYYFITDVPVDPICGEEWPRGSCEFFEILHVEAVTSLSWIIPGKAEFTFLGTAHNPRCMVENYDYAHGKGTLHVLKRVK